jgi:hypothetical protein
MAWFALMHARVDPNAFSAQHASGVPTRIAEQNRCIWMRVACGRAVGAAGDSGGRPHASLARVGGHRFR